MAQGVHPSFISRSFRIRALRMPWSAAKGCEIWPWRARAPPWPCWGWCWASVPGLLWLVFWWMETWKNDEKWEIWPGIWSLEGKYRKIPKQKGWLVGWWTEKRGDLTWFNHLKWGYYGDVTNMNHCLVVWNIDFPLSYFQGVVTANLRTPFMKTLVWQMRVDVDLTVDIGLFGASIWLCLNM